MQRTEGGGVYLAPGFPERSVELSTAEVGWELGPGVVESILEVLWGN